MLYRELNIDETDRIEEIDAYNYIEKAWRKIDGSLQLVTIDWTDHELPEGLLCHKEHFRSTLQHSGKAFGCFEDNLLIGYATLNRECFHTKNNYVLLDQLFISRNYRQHGIGKQLVKICCQQSLAWNAEKLYIAASSSEQAISFYRKIGCIDAKELNEAIYEQDPNNIQLELSCSLYQ